MNVRDVIVLSSFFNMDAHHIEPFLDEGDYHSVLEKTGYSMDVDMDAVRDLIHRVEEALGDGQTIVVTYWDELYPKSLREIDDPPAVLFVRGEKFEVLAKEPKIAVVGSRKATAYGKKIARQLAEELAKAGFVVVSGLAVGVDSQAHHGASVSGETIGVLGNGVDVVYPDYNSRAYETVKAHGCLVSEYPPGTPPYRWNFPRRNRIIAGMSVGVVVVEASEKSGSLITARLAGEYGRDVFAVPGPITSETSKGTNLLIKRGAKLIQSVDDVLEEYSHLPLKAPPGVKKRKAAEDLSEEEERILQLISGGNDTLEKLLTATGWEMGKLITTLSHLEMNEKIAEVGGRYNLI